MTGKYQQQISVTRGTPGCVITLIDESGSMAGEFGLDSRLKSEVVARTINTFIYNLVGHCTKGEDIIDYLHFSAIGYGRGGAYDLLGEGTAPGGLMFMSEINDKAEYEEVEKDDGTGNIMKVHLPKWFNPVNEGGTPMTDAYEMAEKKLYEWTKHYPDSLPPVVLNITDGAPNYKDKAEEAAKSIKNISTSDGNVLIYCCHISGESGEPIKYPKILKTYEEELKETSGKIETDPHLPNEAAQLLFRMSSEIPHSMLAYAKKSNLPVSEGSRGFIYNSDSADLIKFLRIGTVTEFIE